MSTAKMTAQYAAAAADFTNPAAQSGNAQAGAFAFDKNDLLAINTVRGLSADMVQKANSGHPGMPLGMAPVAHVLWTRFMNYDPKDTQWPNRDRFVLSNGHGCALQYSMLHMAGYALTLDDLKNFRQLHSKTPGHPEVHITPGVEVTTGPLGQGIANGVGMAIAEANMAATFNKPGFELFNNFTYVFAGDGCMQEGVASEAASLAGHLGLGKLIIIYDDNSITIDGETHLSFSEDVPKRFEAYGWHTLTVKDGNDLEAIAAAVKQAQAVTNKPTLIALKTIIGFGAPKQGTEEVHGSALGDKGVAALKTTLGLDPAAKFALPAEALIPFKRRVEENSAKHAAWKAMFARYAAQYPKEADELQRRLEGRFPDGWKTKLPKYAPKDKADATRNISGVVLNALAAQMHELIGGSADLTPSNKTALKGVGDFTAKTPANRYLRFGVREHGMAAIGNGIHAYGGLLPFTATFLNFVEYLFPAARLSALSGHHQLYVFTHDSIGLGEDGPTHQPIEALSLCRATPNMLVFRPADGNETVGSYICAMEHQKGPSVMCFSRQNLPQLARSTPESVALGGYVVHESGDGPAKLIIVATGSEVSLAIGAAGKLPFPVRVVSMPCCELFNRQPVAYRRSVITPGVVTVSFEALATLGWERYSHFQIGMTSFGASAPFEALYKHFGFEPEQVAASCLRFMEQQRVASAEMGMAAGVFPLPTHFNSNL